MIGTITRAWLLVVLLTAGLAMAQAEGSGEAPAPALATRSNTSPQMLKIERVFVDTLTGGDTAAQMRDLIIASLHQTGLFVVTENPDRADAVLRGAAEDLIYVDQFSSSEGVDLRTGVTRSTPGAKRGTNRNGLTVGVSDDESINVRERKHEAIATVRLVNKDGDVIWSTTQESNGAKFRGASADVASKITRQLSEDYAKLAQTGH